MSTSGSVPMAASDASAGPVTLLSDMSEADAGEGAAQHEAALGDTEHGGRAQGTLIGAGPSADYRARWKVVQGDFIDAPRSAVTDADVMVGEVLAHVGDTFAQQRKTLQQGWVDEASDTEELRIALPRYRTFFDRLLTL